VWVVVEDKPWPEEDSLLAFGARPRGLDFEREKGESAHRLLPLGSLPALWVSEEALPCPDFLFRIERVVSQSGRPIVSATDSPPSISQPTRALFAALDSLLTVRGVVSFLSADAPLGF